MMRDYLYPELVWLNQRFLNYEEMFATIAKRLVDKHFVTTDYGQTLVNREKDFPTGLELEDYFVAIPHCDFRCIKKKFIAVAVLEKPVMMRKMDEPGQAIPVSLVLFLGIDRAENHLKILKEMIRIIQNKQIVAKIESSNDPAEVIHLLVENTLFKEKREG